MDKLIPDGELVNDDNSINIQKCAIGGSTTNTRDLLAHS